MGNVAYLDGGKTSQEGIHKGLDRYLAGAVPLIHSSTSGAIVQRAAGANMSVDASIGDYLFDMGEYSLWGWNATVENAVVSASDPTNPRIDAIVAYVDLSGISSASNDNPGNLKFKSVTGTPAGSPVAPNAGAIQTSVGGSNPYRILANVAVAAASTTVVNANITDLRVPISFKGRLYGGASNTNGHIVPNVADDTVALLAAVQTFTNKTLTNPIITSYPGWQTDPVAISAVSYLGNRSYSLTRASSIKNTKSVGMRNRYTRTVTAPTQSTSLNGTTQYWEKVTPNKMTWTDDFACGRWIYLTSYARGVVDSRWNGTSGWVLEILADGRIQMVGYNAGVANFSLVESYQSIPLNKWVFVSAQLDMSAFTATSTTSYVMIDGVDVPSVVSRGGTNPTALVQAGNYQIGAGNSLLFFPGKLGPGFVSGIKVTQANMRTVYGQGITATDVTALTIATAINFNGTATDVNTTTPNDMTAVASAGYTTDSPFAGGSSTVNLSYTAGTTEMSVTTAISTDGLTETVQVPEGYALPTSGGISTAFYSGENAYGFPSDKGKWDVVTFIAASTGGITIPAFNVWTTLLHNLTVPIGAWDISLEGTCQGSATTWTHGHVLLAPATPTNADRKYELCAILYDGGAPANTLITVSRKASVSLAVATPYLLYGDVVTSTGTATMQTRGDLSAFVLKAELAYI